MGAYLITALLFTFCNAAIFTFNASLALDAKNSNLVALILSLPLLIPGLLVSLKAAGKTLVVGVLDSIYQDWMVLLLLLLIQVILSISLFNYIWEE